MNASLAEGSFLGGREEEGKMQGEAFSNSIACWTVDINKEFTDRNFSYVVIHRYLSLYNKYNCMQSLNYWFWCSWPQISLSALYYTLSCHIFIPSLCRGPEPTQFCTDFKWEGGNFVTFGMFGMPVCDDEPSLNHLPCWLKTSKALPKMVIEWKLNMARPYYSQFVRERQLNSCKYSAIHRFPCHKMHGLPLLVPTGDLRIFFDTA